MHKIINTPIGNLKLISNGEAIEGIYFSNDNSSEETDNVIQLAEKQLTEYFAGKRKDFDFPMSMQGTDFQKKVWNELKKIPFGETISYKELAKRVGSEKAFRAVGTANGKNPISIVVPCHRVINESGKLGGYAGGLPTKKQLLDLEHAV